MIRATSLTVYRAENSEVLKVESIRDTKYGDNIYLRLEREYYERHYEEIYGFPVKVYMTRRTRPDIKVDMMSVLMNTAKIMEQQFETVISRTKRREYVDVRKTAVMILFDMDFEAMDIERGLPFKDRAVYDYRSKMEDRFITQPSYIKEYEHIREKVMELTFNKKKDD